MNKKNFLLWAIIIAAVLLVIVNVVLLQRVKQENPAIKDNELKPAKAEVSSEIKKTLDEAVIAGENNIKESKETQKPELESKGERLSGPQAN